MLATAAPSDAQALPPPSAPLMTTKEEAKFKDKIISKSTEQEYSVSRRTFMYDSIRTRVGFGGMTARLLWGACGNGRQNLWVVTTWFYLTWLSCSLCAMYRIMPRLQEAYLGSVENPELNALGMASERAPGVSGPI